MFFRTERPDVDDSLGPANALSTAKKHVRTRRSRSTMANFVIYNVNINGLNSKLDSCIEILTNLAPEVVTLCELKTTQVSMFKQRLNEMNYELISKRRVELQL